MNAPDIQTCAKPEDAGPELPGSGWEAFLGLGYQQRDGKTVLSHREHCGPLRVQRPFYPEGDDICHTIVLHPPGGVAGGDRLTLEANLAPASKAVLVTPGAGKWYRSGGRPAHQQLRFNLAQASVLEWLPQETILFNGAYAHMDMEVNLDHGAVFTGWDILCFGRSASGERFSQGQLRQSVRIALAGKPIWYESGRLQAGGPMMHALSGLAGRTVSGTLILAGKAIPDTLLDRCRAISVDQTAGEYCAVTALPNVLIARYLGHRSTAAKAHFIKLWTVLRPHAAGRNTTLPRIWHT